MPALAPTTNIIHSPRATPQAPRGRVTARGGNSSGKGRGASDKGATQTMARESALLYVTTTLMLSQVLSLFILYRILH